MELSEIAQRLLQLVAQDRGFVIHPSADANCKTPLFDWIPDHPAMMLTGEERRTIQTLIKQHYILVRYSLEYWDDHQIGITRRGLELLRSVS